MKKPRTLDGSSWRSPRGCVYSEASPPAQTPSTASPARRTRDERAPPGDAWREAALLPDGEVVPVRFTDDEATTGPVHLPGLVVLIRGYLNARPTGEVQRQRAAGCGECMHERPGVQGEGGPQQRSVRWVQVMLAALDR